MKCSNIAFLPLLTSFVISPGIILQNMISEFSCGAVDYESGVVTAGWVAAVAWVLSLARELQDAIGEAEKRKE